MSDEIKVGDVCEVIDACCEASRSCLLGVEVVVTGPQRKPSTVCPACGFRDFNYLDVHNPDIGRHGGIPRKWLRRKPPKADESQWIREATMPRRDFDRWLEEVREAAQVEEPA